MTVSDSNGTTNLRAHQVLRVENSARHRVDVLLCRSDRWEAEAHELGEEPDAEEVGFEKGHEFFARGQVLGALQLALDISYGQLLLPLTVGHYWLLFAD